MKAILYVVLVRSNLFQTELFSDGLNKMILIVNSLVDFVKRTYLFDFFFNRWCNKQRE